MKRKAILLTFCLLAANTAPVQAKYTTAKALAAAYIVCTAIPLAEVLAEEVLGSCYYKETWMHSLLKKVGIPGLFYDKPASSNWYENRSPLNYIFLAPIAGVGALAALVIEYGISK